MQLKEVSCNGARFLLQGPRFPIWGHSFPSSVALTGDLFNCLIVGHSPGSNCIGPQGASKNFGLTTTNQRARQKIFHPTYGRYGNAGKTSKTISTIALLWPLKAIFEKRAATVEVDTFISPGMNFGFPISMTLTLSNSW